MLRSLFSGVSGMKNNQIKMDVISNNIANVNTTAFKAGRVRFQDILSQTIKSASSPTGTAADPGMGGVNPRQVGLGMQVAGIDTITNQGSLQPTGRPLDAAIEGEGYFILSDGPRTVYSRDGAFNFDSEFNIVNSDGFRLMGYPAAGSDVVIDGNVPGGTVEKWSDAGVGSLSFSDSAITINGNKIDLRVGTDPDDPDNGIYYLGSTPTISDAIDKINQITADWPEEEKITVALDSDGTAPDGLKFTSAKGIAITGGTGVFAGINVEESGLTSLSIPETKADGSRIKSFSIEPDGTIRGVYEDDTIETLGQIALASFENPGGLLKLGGNNFSVSNNSGTAQIGKANAGGRGVIQQSVLEMSNVDLANEFTEMIITSRAYQANSRSITTSDEMLQELLNLKR